MQGQGTCHFPSNVGWLTNVFLFLIGVHCNIMCIYSSVGPVTIEQIMISGMVKPLYWSSIMKPRFSLS
jgi:hypothetical protein